MRILQVVPTYYPAVRYGGPIFAVHGLCRARAARNVGIPYVLSPRGMLVKDLIARRSRLAKSAWIRLIERANVEQATAIHLTSQLEAAELARFGWRLPRLAVIPNATDEPLS